ncbi:hypothetical protein NDK43_09495 [Neobacillus pocheonensis]|uniref:Uncharacterized protein n=1 Tax=Neobacillus pocheonensis TaxID=363869 RepID=A0ABT0W8C6_9BACI|nr:hypothetical protein [Neobacillus pocheonensis]
MKKNEGSFEEESIFGALKQMELQMELMEIKNVLPVKKCPQLISTMTSDKF